MCDGCVLYKHTCVLYKHVTLLWIYEMSAYVSKPSSFGDDTEFDSHSTPDINYTLDPILPPIAPVSTTTTTKTVVAAKESTMEPVVAPSCNIHAPPWPTIIISVLGAIIVVYTAVAPNVNTDRRIFGIIMMTLWTIVWALILWVLWKECHRAVTWWLLLIPVAIMALFFIVIILMNIGAP